MIRNRQKKRIVWEAEHLNPNDVPWYGRKTVLEHEERYRFAGNYVKNKKVIDLGCGTGNGSLALVKSGAKKVFAVDVNSDAIAFAIKYYDDKKISYSVSDAVNTKLPPKIADVVVSFEVIEHLIDPVSFLKEIKRLLKPAGFFIISTPNLETSFGDNPYHIHEFTKNELDQMLSIFGFVQFFGQRKVNPILIKFYKGVASNIRHPFLRMLLRFRPWERYSIHPLRDSETYLYLLAVCKKK